MKKSKLLILFPVMGLFLSGCTFQEGLQSTKSWIKSHIYQPLKSFFGSSSTPSEEGKKEEEKKEETKVPFPSSEIEAFVKSLGLSDTVPEYSGTAISYKFTSSAESGYGYLDIEVGTGNESAGVSTYGADLKKVGYTEMEGSGSGAYYYLSKNEELELCVYDGNSASTPTPGFVFVDISEYIPVEVTEGFPVEAANAFLTENEFGFTISESEGEALSALAEVFGSTSGEGTYGPYLQVYAAGSFADDAENILKENITSNGYTLNSEASYAYYENDEELSVQFYEQSGYTIIMFY